MSDPLARHESLRGYRIRMNRSLLTDQLKTQQLSAIARDGGGGLPVSQAPFRTINPPFHGDGDQVTMKKREGPKIRTMRASEGFRQHNALISRNGYRCNP